MQPYDPTAELAAHFGDLRGVVFGLDRGSVAHVERDVLRTLHRLRVEPTTVWDPTLLAAIGDVVRLLGQVQADMTGDPDGAVAIADWYRSAVERCAPGAELWGLRSVAAELSASAHHRTGRYRESVNYAAVAYQLAEDFERHNPAGALVVKRRALAVMISGTRELARADDRHAHLLRGLIDQAEGHMPTLVEADVFDRDGVNPLASQTFFASAAIGLPPEVIERWYWNARRARGAHRRHLTTQPLLTAVFLRSSGHAAAAGRAEQQALEQLLAAGLLRHVASLSRRDLWSAVTPPRAID